MLEFNEEKHEYTLNGKKLISVTQLMQKHGLATSYAGVSTEVLQAKAERGSLIHKEIEDFNKSGAIGFTDEMAQFKEYIESNKINVVASEMILNNDIVAGTCDLILDDSNQIVIADIKTTYELHKESVSWQLSIYCYLYTLDKDVIKYNNFKGQAFHFNKEGKLNVVDIPLKPYEEIEKLMECERKGEIYKYEVKLKEDNISQIASLEQIIKDLDKQVKEAKAKQDELKAVLLQEMKERDLKTFEKNGLKITLVEPSKNVKTIDYEKMNRTIVSEYEEAKAKYDEEALKYTKEEKIPQTAYLKITIKEKKND